MSANDSNFLQYEIIQVSDDLYQAENLVLMYDLCVPIRLWDCELFDKFLHNDIPCFEIKDIHEYDNKNTWLRYIRNDNNITIPIWSCGRLYDTCNVSMSIALKMLSEMNHDIRKYQKDLQR